MKRVSIAFLLVALTSKGFAQNLSKDDDDFTIQLNTITTAVPFLIISPDSRAGAMGDVGAATSPDVNSFHWNTAKLSFSKEKAEFGVSYSPWLRQLVEDIHLSYLAGYTKIGRNHAVGGSLRYFSLGNITFTDVNGTVTRDFSPNEFEVLGGYAFRLSERSSVGFNGKFVYSNLTAGVNVGSTGTKPGLAGAVDLSYAYVNEDIRLGNKNATLSVGTTISNIGNKIAYTVDSHRDFLPTNLRIGTGLNIRLDKYNSLLTTVDFNKLLVPTPPERGIDGEIISGKDNQVPVVTGILQSFYDAPGNVFQNADSTYEVEKNSRLGEEFREVNIGLGLEYWYSTTLAVRLGYFNEHPSKGARQYLTFGAGVYYSVFGIDVSYLVANRTNPLANTVRFSLKFKFGGNNGKEASPSNE
ncbi:MAG: type IX secretion system outer membrane channel protein PorV [Crocinitomicaceae bacterium]|nr:type IX secretion system outer membrane channel protein PorV [Crocinitomicaceae bacterium]